MKRVKRNPHKRYRHYGGLPKHIVKSKYRRDVKTLATVGLSVDEIARFLANKYDIKISGDTVSRYYQRQLETALPSLLGLAKKGLRKALIAGQAWAICFTLKTRAKQYGWIERAEVTGKDGLPIFDLSKLNDDELQQFRDLRQKAIDDAKKG